ncbi:MAG: TVP38/TMEM64 family protein [Sciscionella sp.]
MTPSSEHRRATASVFVRVVRSPWPRLLLLLVLLGTSTALAVTRGTQILLAARQDVASLGAWGPVVFVLVYTLATILVFPDALLSAVAGLLFGPVLGILTVWLGAMLGAGASFLFGRALSREAIERLVGRRIDRLNAFLAHRGFVAVLLVRLIPLFPFGLVNYGSAVTAIGLRSYLLGTALGILPGVGIYVVLGGSITDLSSPAFLISAGALLVLALGGALAARWIGKRSAAATDHDEEG